MEELDIVTLVDEDGVDTRFQHILTFFYEGQRYIALTPEEEAEQEEQEIVLLHAVEEDGDYVYCPIENEVLLNEVFDEFLDLMEEREEGDGEGTEE